MMNDREGKKRILVVDDEFEICNFVKMFFELRGFDVARAQNGADALAAAQKHSPHIVLLDVHLSGSGEDGLSLLPKILEASPSTKVVMTTGVDDEASIQRARSLGAVDYLTKPLALEELEATVSRYTQARRGEARPL